MSDQPAEMADVDRHARDMGQRAYTVGLDVQSNPFLLFDQLRAQWHIGWVTQQALDMERKGTLYTARGKDRPH